ncbi:unnamed protein product [Enterobius vermicularis]|uniref:Toxin_TOLIP domain-containing protein n=1 Tax=Enterobius vermicularis TaxID=51028 RepID=A0A0N4V029_ENTVE|nr:unnamed protein product [Enterobius vermicularis]
MIAQCSNDSFVVSNDNKSLQCYSCLDNFNCLNPTKEFCPFQASCYTLKDEGRIIRLGCTESCTAMQFYNGECILCIQDLCNFPSGAANRGGIGAGAGINNDQGTRGGIGSGVHSGGSDGYGGGIGGGVNSVYHGEIGEGVEHQRVHGGGLL